MLNGKFRIAARTSPLALKQVGEAAGYIKALYPEFCYEVIGITTWGDRDKITPISDIEGSDFFTREVDEAVLSGEADFAVHSAKDLPDAIPGGLVVAAITEPLDSHDALVSKNNLKLAELPLGARIGASSARRKSQLKAYRNDFQIIDIRGNIEERLAALDGGGLDAVIVAACALMRLGLEDRIAQRVPFNILKPHPKQGSLAVVAKKNDKEIQGLFDRRRAR